jgi:hypothetical protein
MKNPEWYGEEGPVFELATISQPENLGNHEISHHSVIKSTEALEQG